MNCQVEGCERPALARDFCGMHYQRWRKYGDPLVSRSPAAPTVSVGERYGRLLVVAEAGTNRHKQRRYEVRCDCGNTRVVAGFSLTQGATQSCGCLHRERFHKRTHGLSGTPTYHTWKNMLERCRNPNRADFERYGEKGIRVCPRWDPRKGGSFANFLADMGEQPQGAERMSIDRIDPQRDYEPGNCRWLSVGENSRRAHLGIPHT